MRRERLEYELEVIVAGRRSYEDAGERVLNWLKTQEIGVQDLLERDMRKVPAATINRVCTSSRV
jgi:hypothetical protein